MKKIYFALIPLLGLFIACGNSYVLDEESLEDVLVDIHLAEGILLENSHQFTSQESKIDLFNSIYKKHHIDKARFDSSLVYYSDDPMTLSDIYENVYKQLEGISKNVERGQYALTKNRRSKAAYQLMLREDLELLPIVKSEFWTGEKTYSFGANKFSPFSNTIANDSIEGDIVFRFTLNSDSISAAQLNVQLNYATDSISQQFALATEHQGVFELKWTIDKEIKSIDFDFRAEKLNTNSQCDLSDFRIYNISAEQKDINIF